MARPKRKVVEAQGVDTTTIDKEPVEIKPVKEDETPIKVVKVEEVKIEPRPLKKGDTFLFIKDGMDVYYTRSTANVIFQRNSASMVIPKGSQYIPPKGSKCDGCG
jgi:ribosomal protein S4E